MEELVIILSSSFTEYSTQGQRKKTTITKPLNLFGHLKTREKYQIIKFLTSVTNQRRLFHISSEYIILKCTLSY